jgi:CheY-like chemotaxis protein
MHVLHEVLVIDDEPAIRRMLEDVLVAEGHDVVCATDGQEGLTLLRSGLRPCVILLDLMMPRLNGWQVAAALKEDGALRHIPFAVIAANPRFASVASSIGACRWLGKPIDLDDLLGLIESHCSGQ